MAASGSGAAERGTALVSGMDGAGGHRVKRRKGGLACTAGVCHSMPPKPFERGASRFDYLAWIRVNS